MPKKQNRDARRTREEYEERAEDVEKKPRTQEEEDEKRKEDCQRKPEPTPLRGEGGGQGDQRIREGESLWLGYEVEYNVVDE